MSRGILPEMLATFWEILPEHGDLVEYLQARATHNRNTAGQYSEDAEVSQLDTVLLRSLLEAQHLRVASQSSPATARNYRSRNLSSSQAQNDSLDLSELDAALALSLEEEEPRANSSLSAAGNRLLNYTRNNSLDLELDAAIALSLEEQAEEEEDDEEDFIAQSLIFAADELGAPPASISVPVTAQDDIDPDDMTFEQLESLGEAVGSESRGLSKEILDSFPVQKLVTKSRWFSSSKANPEACPICATEYEIGSRLLTLPCLHMYHKSCIKEWLKRSKTCPICKTDMSVPQD